MVAEKFRATPHASQLLVLRQVHSCSLPPLRTVLDMTAPGAVRRVPIAAGDGRIDG